ncbi:MAG: peptidoglycan-associated lipoprotein Pal [candidate division KSB1 bacterium]|nr:peptidoglycan-associated lipoprotein Pal [candidate division KSB1 bacterium]MDZ7304500.1 peptidoglycan-associated lipoprotein Pal [candidate division KSB1 bacterium]MDZ7313880.1 peptidoglycan-associated lipoprotein Pal [candidate division KSB1 bacterium]
MYRFASTIFMRTNKAGLLFMLILSILAVAGCSGSKKTLEPTTTEEPAPPMEIREPEPAAPAETEPIEETKSAIETESAASVPFVLQNIYFDFDKYDLTPEALQTLAENARVLKNYPEVRVIIAGHCDERGTIEYNLALGDKRAKAARDYLLSLNVDPAQISTISYGKERPLDPRHNEEAWAKNRRAAFERR